MRRRCLTRGHKFRSFMPGAPYVFCARWRCSASAVGYAASDPVTAAAMHNAIPREDRFPPVELTPDGAVASEWEQGRP